MADLVPHDLIIQILSWLPPKDLIRLRTLCKLWFSTIADPEFIQLHLSHFGNSRRNNTAGLILIPRYDYAGVRGIHIRQIDLFVDSNASLISTEQVDNSNTRGTWKFSGSCNGLICCYKYYTYCRTNHGPIFVWNPSIRRSIHLPEYQFPEQSLFTYGIGFDPIEGDYKILMVRFKMSASEPDCNQYSAVYSLKSKLWKKVEALVPEGFAIGDSIFLNGSIHWIFLPMRGHKKSLLVYDVNNEVFREMSLPNEPFKDKEMPLADEELEYGLYVVKGSLCVFIWGWGEGKGFTPCEVWIMKEYGVIGSWTMQFYNNDVLSVGITEMIAATVGGKFWCHCGRDVPNQRKLAYEDGNSVEAHMGSRLVLFDPQTSEFTCVSDLGWDDQVYSLVGSMESLNF